MKKCVVFTVQGEFARFRKPYTTTSALTFTTAHPIAVKGLLGAMLGIDKTELYEKTKDYKIGISVLNPVKKDMQSFNLLTMKGKGLFRFPSNVEFLRSVAYRIFVACEDEAVVKIEKVLKSKEFVFTPYLGASEHIASVKYEGVINVENFAGTVSKVDTVIPTESIQLDMDMVTGHMYSEVIPVRNDILREYKEYKKVFFSTESNLLFGEINDVYKVGEYNVYFF
ncbi:MAG: type I-B CRISPR-associated protein Cas5b [Alkaliphilus sp.]